MKLKFKLQIFLIAALICCLIASAAFADNLNGVSTAADPIPAQDGDAGNGVKWYYDGKGTTTFSYTGSGSGVIPDYDMWRAPWRKVKDDTVSLRIEEGVTHIGKRAFEASNFRRARGRGWKRAFIADTVKTIGDNAFEGCFDICSVSFGKNLEKIGKEAFTNPSAMTTIIMPPALKEIGERAFMQAFSLKVLTFTVPKPEDYHDLDIGENAFYDRRGTIKIAYTSEKGILIDRNTKEEIVEGSELKEGDLSNRQLTWIRHTPKNYVITYDANGGRMTGGITTQRVPVNSTTKLYTQAQLGLSYPESPLFFKGWSTDKNAKKATYRDGANYTVTDDVTLYAIWGPPSFFITFDANGGKFTTDDPTQEIYQGETEPLRLASDDLGLSSPSEDLCFIGWATTTERAKDFEVDYKDGASCTPTASMTLYAVWKKKPLITFDPNEAKGGRFISGDNTISFFLIPDETVKMPSAQKLGLYNISDDLFFMGWSRTLNGNVDYDDASYFTPMDDMTLHAVWRTDGDGTDGDPYIIDSFNRLKELSTNANEKTSEYAYFRDKHFLLTVDIDATSEDWKPIGKAYSNSFNGHFDGGGHLIIYKISKSTEPQQGLFGYISEGASIKKLRVQAEIIGGGVDVGGIVGTVGLNSTVTNCYSVVNLTTTEKSGSFSDVHIGGIAGCCNIGTIEYCSVNGTLNDNDVENFRVGGIVGVNQEGKITRCTAITNVGSTKNYTGMITGDNMDEDFSKGTIQECNYSSVWAKGYKGVGYNEGTRDTTNTKAMSNLELRAYVKDLSDQYAIYKGGIVENISGASGENDSSDLSSGVMSKSDVEFTQSPNAEKIKGAISAISNIAGVNVYLLSDDANVTIGEARTADSLSDADKKTIGNVKYMEVLPEIVINQKPGIYVFSVSADNIPAGTPIAFNRLPQNSSGSSSYSSSLDEDGDEEIKTADDEISTASSEENYYIFFNDDLDIIEAVPSGQTFNVAVYFEDGTYDPVIAGGAQDTTAGTGSKGSSSGCNAGFGIGLAALLLVPFGIKKFKRIKF